MAPRAISHVGGEEVMEMVETDFIISSIFVFKLSILFDIFSCAEDGGEGMEDGVGAETGEETEEETTGFLSQSPLLPPQIMACGFYKPML
ncbi:11292_t:CDS:2 [Paraglomus occultum]|uniref:11292_t:CDS:1 n=1 Tax=Paraglomus occultum TaxID=144539 RepID=A0A9N9AQ67_9GLOM|nr:11292_t:CDS:2 [Paraglomus occultum]